MHKWANSNQDSTRTRGSTSTQRTFPEHPYQVIRESVPLGPTEHLLIRPPYNVWETEQVYLTHTQTHKGSQYGKTKKQAPNGRTGEISRKISEMETSSLPIESSKQW